MPTGVYNRLPKSLTTEERFWANVDKTNIDGCWLWLRSNNGKGYGQFVIDGKKHYAHRYAYELIKGVIPKGMTLDHLCRNPYCVNPAHLEPVSNRTNLLRGNTIFALNVAKTHCPHGHPYDLLNTYLYRGDRYCRKCLRLKPFIGVAEC